jgi:branched-chain amino acid transport system substrate-binding protein
VFFSQPATGVHQADLFAQWIAGLAPEGRVDQRRPETAAYVHRDAPFQEEIATSIKEQLELINVKTRSFQKYPDEAEQRDLQPIARAIQAQNPDMVVNAASASDGVEMINAFRATGFSPKILFQTTAPAVDKDFIDGIGVENTDGVFFAVSWSKDAGYPLNAEYVRAYQATFGNVATEDAANAFAAGQVLQAAAEGVGEIDNAKMADWLHTNTVQTILGPLSWDEAGRPEGSFILGQWQGKQSRIVLPRNVANTDKIVNPKPPWGSAPPT